MDFLDIKITKDPEAANYQNYLIWQAQHEARRRESATQFNVFQSRARQRLFSQALYKQEAEQQSEALKNMIERRLSQACECSDCDRGSKERSNSMSSVTPSSPTNSVRSSSSSLGPSLTTTKSNGFYRGPSSRNTLILNPPPRSRHHRRRNLTTTS